MITFALGMLVGGVIGVITLAIIQGGSIYEDD